MQRIVPLLLAAAGLTLVWGTAAGCNRASAYDGKTGEEIYSRVCETCHGRDGKAVGRDGGSYRAKRKHWSEETLLEYIDNPEVYKRQGKGSHLQGRYMVPVDKYMPDDARRRVVKHVLKLMDALE